MKSTYQLNSSVQSLSRVRLFATPWIAARQASLSITIYRSSLKLTSIESVMPSSHLILCRPLLLLPPIPWTVACQAPPPMGFSRQECWSGLPFLSPMHESEKWKSSCSVVSNSSRPHGLQPTRLLHLWDFPGKSAGMGCHCLLLPFTSLMTLGKSLMWCVK